MMLPHYNVKIGCNKHWCTPYMCCVVLQCFITCCYADIILLVFFRSEEILQKCVNITNTRLVKGQTKLTFTWHTPNRVNIK